MGIRALRWFPLTGGRRLWVGDARGTLHSTKVNIGIPGAGSVGVALRRSRLGLPIYISARGRSGSVGSVPTTCMVTLPMTLPMGSPACCPPGLPHVRKSRDSEDFSEGGRGLLFADPGRWATGTPHAAGGLCAPHFLDLGPSVAYGREGPLVRIRPVGGSERPVGGLELPVGGLRGLGHFDPKLLVDTSAAFLYGKIFMALYVNWLFPYKKLCAQG